MRRSTSVVGFVIVFVITGAVGACDHGEQQELAFAPESALPAMVRGSPTVVREAYRFALANPAILSRVPCYCGCGNVGHTSNLSCYVQGTLPDGSIRFDNHALG
jgi:hypothetical protein